MKMKIAELKDFYCYECRNKCILNPKVIKVRKGNIYCDNFIQIYHKPKFKIGEWIAWEQSHCHAGIIDYIGQIIKIRERNKGEYFYDTTSGSIWEGFVRKWKRRLV